MSPGPQKKETRTRDVNPIRLKTFLDALGQEMGYAETSRAIDALPPEGKDICKSLERPEWLPIAAERAILEELISKFKFQGRMRNIGKECVQFILVHFITAFPGSHTIRSILSHFPSLSALFMAYLRLTLEEGEDNRSFKVLIEYKPEVPEWEADIEYIAGMVEGFLNFIKIRRADLRAERMPGMHVISVKIGETDQGAGDMSPLDRVINTQETFVWQVIHRSAELLKDKKELATAVDYLNMANNELEREIRSNKAELNMARNIQRGFIPTLLPDWNGIQFAVKFLPMKEVSGDHYDYFMLPDGKLAVLVGDVSGHGVPAALISAIVKLSFNNHKQNVPADVFGNVNLDLINYVKMEGYLTAFYIVLSPDYEILYSLAGMPAPLLYRKHSGVVEKLQGAGVLLGMFPDAAEQFINQKTTLEPGDMLVIFTDGLTEAVDPEGEFFGEDRLKAAIAEVGQAAMNVDQAADHIMSRYREFVLGEEQSDDITVLVIGISEKRGQFQKLLGRAGEAKKARDWAAACGILEEAIAMFPRHPDALYLHAKYLAAAGRYEESLAAVRRFSALKPNSPEISTITAYCMMRQGHWDRAEKELKKSLSLRSMNPSALYHLVRVYMEQKRTVEAETFLEALKFLLPNHPALARLEADLRQKQAQG
ncbi:MAG: SpoIIE family protein phosphatase [Spirochaetia bacterium]|nr:SpoIIE family protein phosphatase [Spirochaetia bacterium]